MVAAFEYIHMLVRVCALAIEALHALSAAVTFTLSCWAAYIWVLSFVIGCVGTLFSFSIR